MKRTTLCYIEQNSCYLMLYRNKKENDENAGKWIGIGGKIEEGETADECCVREVFEETGLTLKKVYYRGLVHFRSDVFCEDMYLYTADEFTGTLSPDCNEGELSWVPIDKVPTLQLWEGDRVFLKMLAEGKKDFVLTLTYKGDELIDASVTT